MIEIKLEKGFPKTHLSLKQGDVFHQKNYPTFPYLVLESSRVVDLLRGRLHVIADFSGEELIVAKRATLTLEI